MKPSHLQSLRGGGTHALLGLAWLLLAAGCSQDAGVASVLVVSIVEVSPPSGSVVPGQTLQLTATPKTEGGIPLPADDVVWSSTDNTIATVTSAGIVTGLAIGGPVRIRATLDGVTGETRITVVPLPVHHVTVTPGQNAILVGQAAQLTATAYDSNGAVLSGRTFIWSSDASSIAAITSTGLALGMAQGGPVTITANAEGKAGSASVTVSRRPAARLGFGQQPGQTIAGIPLTPAVIVLVQDDLLGTVTDAVDPVTIALAGNSAGGTLSGTRTVAAVNGVATFANLVLDRAGSGYTLVATAPGLTSAISAPFTVIAGAANKLALTTPPPATARSGVAFGTHPVVQIRDGSNNPVSQSGVLVTAAIASGNGTLGGTVAVTTNASGTATFPNLSIVGTVGAFTLSFSAPDIAPVTSGTIALSAGVPAKLDIVTQPSATAQSGVPLARQPMVRLLDGHGNTVLQSGVAITGSIASGPAGGSLGGSVVASTDGNGVAAFTGLALTGPAGSYLLGFGSGALPAATSAPVVLGAGVGVSLSLRTQPSAQVVNASVFPQQPAVQLRDAAGNPVAQAGVLVAASIQTGGGQLGGGAAVATDAAGVAVFANLAITGQTGDRTLLFASAGYVSVVSGTVTVGAGPATQLAVTGQPSASVQDGVAFPQQPVIQLQDVSGNPVSQAGVPVSVAVAGDAATLGGVATVNTDASGRAAFTGLSITGKAGNYTLAFSAPGLAGTSSAAIALAAGLAAQLAITTQPSPAASNGEPFARQPVVQVQDASGNPVSGAQVTAAIASGGGSLGGTTIATTDGNGVAAFSGLAITGLAGGHTLSFTAPGVGPVASSSIALSAGAASQLILATQPASTAQSGVAFPQQPVVRVADVSGNPVSGVVVTAAIATGGGTLGGTSTATSTANGMAAFTNLSISGTIGSRTLGFTASGIPAATSNTVDLIAGPAAQLVIIQQPSDTATHGIPFSRQPILQVADAAGNGVSGASVKATINPNISNGKLSGTLTIVTDAAGLATFTNLQISRSSLVAYTIKFSSGTLPTVTSSGIRVH